MREFLKKLLASLERISVSGKDNLDILLGCMMSIEEVIEQLEKQVKQLEGEGEDDG
jgi:hypothetical protein